MSSVRLSREIDDKARADEMQRARQVGHPRARAVREAVQTIGGSPSVRAPTAPVPPQRSKEQPPPDFGVGPA